LIFIYFYFLSYLVTALRLRSFVIVLTAFSAMALNGKEPQSPDDNIESGNDTPDDEPESVINGIASLCVSPATPHQTPVDAPDIPPVRLCLRLFHKRNFSKVKTFDSKLKVRSKVFDSTRRFNIEAAAKQPAAGGMRGRMLRGGSG